MPRLLDAPFPAWAAALALTGAIPAQHAPAATRASTIDYATQVEPILAEHCMRCHGEKKHKGDVRFDVLDPTMSTGAAAATWHAALDMLHRG
ncbi:MAG TPA: c-type cytochrome domain-containing protein, partial [Planctomycetota bacterium]|nr:c-type cytochrome domain-containing protein [Planctomycetota bacterium]